MAAGPPLRGDRAIRSSARARTMHGVPPPPLELSPATTRRPIGITSTAETVREWYPDFSARRVLQARRCDANNRHDA